VGATVTPARARFRHPRSVLIGGCGRDSGWAAGATVGIATVTSVTVADGGCKTRKNPAEFPFIFERYGIVPRKIRELKSALQRAGCVCENAKGSHAKWSHPAVSDKLILSGNDGADAKPYQEKMVANFLHTIQVKP